MKFKSNTISRAAFFQLNGILYERLKFQLLSSEVEKEEKKNIQLTKVAAVSEAKEA